MSNIKSVYMGIYDDLCMEILSMQAIAEKYGCPVKWVHEVWDQLCLEEHMDSTTKETVDQR